MTQTLIHVVHLGLAVVCVAVVSNLTFECFSLRLLLLLGTTGEDLRVVLEGRVVLNSKLGLLLVLEPAPLRPGC